MTSPPLTLNLGIVAHVDAGKTSLTERLLFEAGAIDVPGSVDAGTTRTDSLDLERRRGITIRAAVTSFAVDDVVVNLVDTPGHPDFIAEVERSLGVLDAAVLVLSSVEGVQPQTVVIWRALQRIGVPTVLFVNKVDRSGADVDAVLEEVRRRLTPHVVALTQAHGCGARDAWVTSVPLTSDDVVLALAEGDDARPRRLGLRPVGERRNRPRGAAPWVADRSADSGAVRLGHHRRGAAAAARRVGHPASKIRDATGRTSRHGLRCRPRRARTPRVGAGVVGGAEGP